MKRKRINISINEDLYKKLQRIKTTYGFKNVCEINVALLNIMCSYIDKAEQRETAVVDNEDDISKMFNEYGKWERTPEGIVPVRHNNKVYNGER